MGNSPFREEEAVAEEVAEHFKSFPFTLRTAATITPMTNAGVGSRPLLHSGV